MDDKLIYGSCVLLVISNFKVRTNIVDIKLIFIVVMLILTGCGGGSSSTAPSTNAPSTNAPSTQTGYLIDSYVDGVEYFLNGTYTGLTNNGGSFSYHDNDTITFKIGEVEIGYVASVSSDNRVTLQDICGVARNWSDYPQVINIATFLQSLDDDNYPKNGINISSSIRQLFTEPLKLKELDYSEIVVLIKNAGKAVRSKVNVQSHIEYVMLSAGITPIILDEYTIPPYYDSKVGLPPLPKN